MAFPSRGHGLIIMPPPEVIAPRHQQLRQFGRIADDFEVENAIGKPGTVLPLRIRLPQSDKQNFKFLMFRSLPANFKLSAGFGTQSYWVVSLNDVYGLSVTTPPDAKGTFEMEVLLFRGEGAEPERRQTKVVLQSDFAAKAARRDTPTPGSDSANDSPPRSPVSADLGREKPTAPVPVEMTLEDQTLLQKGNQLFEEGNVPLARLFFQRLANKGVASGALALAQTFDADFLNELGVRGGVKPDPVEAKKWYNLSSELLSGRADRYGAGP